MQTEARAGAVVRRPGTRSSVPAPDAHPPCAARSVAGSPGPGPVARDEWRTTLIIATLDRPRDLARCLESVGKLGRGFDEIIVVEQGDVEATKDVVERHGDPSVCVCHQTIRSLTRARNSGVKKAKGDLVFFVDDDTVLDEHYVETAVDYLAEHPDVVGLTGRLDEGPPRGSRLWRRCRRGIARLLLVSSPRRSVLRSGANTLPDHHAKTPTYHDCQWLHGCHMVYRRSVFDAGFRFDERLIRWGFGEDVMFSYQLYKHYGPGSLACLPAFRLRHRHSPERSLTDEAAIRMRVIYRFVFWRQEVYGGSLLNACCYLYSQIGFSIEMCRTYPHAPLLVLRTLARSYRYLLAHHRAIAGGRIDHNRFVLEG